MPEVMEQPRTAAAPKRKAATTTTNGRLNASERKLLRRHESTIRHHFETFKLAGEALADIRDKRLYRETHATFEQYCREKWEMSKTQANRLIAAARVVENIAKVAPEAVAHLSESAVRPLTNLSPKKQQEAFKKAVEIAPRATGLTGRVVSQAAHQVSPQSFRAPVRETRDGGDLIRRSELLDELNGWEKEVRQSGKFERMAPRDVVRAIRQIIQKL